MNKQDLTNAIGDFEWALAGQQAHTTVPFLI